MRVLQIHTRYLQAGGELSVVEAESRLLRAAGHEVIEWRNANPDRPHRQAASLLVSPWNPRQAKRVRAAAAASRPDVAHVHNTWYATSPAVLPALKRLDLPVVMTLHNFRLTCANAVLVRDGQPCELCVGSHPWHGVRYRCYRDSHVASAFSAATIAVNRRLGTWVGNVDRFVALTEFSRRILVRGGLPDHKITVKPNFVADPGPRRVSTRDADTVLFAGRLTEGKGIVTALEAWQRAGLEDLRLVVAGDGPLAGSLRSRAWKNVEFAGWLEPDALRQLMLSSRALLFPSRYYENMPMVLVEALAAGLPVLSSDRGSMPEIVGGIGSEWLIPPDDTDAWARAMAILADGQAVDEAGRVARTLYEAHHSEQVGLERLVELYSF